MFYFNSPLVLLQIHDMRSCMEYMVFISGGASSYYLDILDNLLLLTNLLTFAPNI